MSLKYEPSSRRLRVSEGVEREDYSPRERCSPPPRQKCWERRSKSNQIRLQPLAGYESPRAWSAGNTGWRARRGTPDDALDQSDAVLLELVPAQLNMAHIRQSRLDMAHIRQSMHVYMARIRQSRHI